MKTLIVKIWLYSSKHDFTGTPPSVAIVCPEDTKIEGVSFEWASEGKDLELISANEGR